MTANLELLISYAPILNFQLILSGLFVGAIFALVAYGLALVWGVMNVKNLAQGELVIMGGYIYRDSGRYERSDFRRALSPVSH